MPKASHAGLARNAVAMRSISFRFGSDLSVSHMARLFRDNGRIGNDWHENKTALFHHPASEMLHEGRKALLDAGKPITTGGLMAELSFGFWVTILGLKYDTSLWIPVLRHAFSHRPRRTERHQVQGALNAIRRLRNRVAHHEPIMHRQLDEDHDLILRVIYWSCPETSKWVESQSRFPSILG